MRVDFIFSYWVVFWFVLYLCGLSYNPKFALITVAIINMIEILIMIFYNRQIKTILSFTLIIIVFKLFPIYMLRKTSIQTKDMYAFICLFLLYSIWIYLNHTSSIQIKDIHSLLHDKSKTPMIALLDQFFK